MRICFYTFTFLPTVGGAELLLHRLAESLVRRNHHVTIWAPRISRKENRMDTSYRLFRYPKPISKRFGVRQTIPFLLWEKMRRGMDILHCHGAYPAAYVGASAKKILGVPLIVRPHGADILPHEWIRQNPRLERRMIRALSAADRIVAQGHSLETELLALGIPAERIKIIHNGVEKIHRPSNQRSSTPPYLFSMGSLSPKKGYDVLIHAFHIVASELPDLHIRIAGSGSQREELSNLVSSLSLQDRIQWLGEIDTPEKERQMQGALAYVCPSRREPFSNALLEALSWGLPIIATSVGGNTEIIEHGKSGCLIPPENPEALRNAIRRIAHDHSLRQHLSSEALKRASKFDWEDMVDQYEKLYFEHGTTKK